MFEIVWVAELFQHIDPRSVIFYRKTLNHRQSKSSRLKVDEGLISFELGFYFEAFLKGNGDAFGLIHVAVYFLLGIRDDIFDGVRMNKQE